MATNLNLTQTQPSLKGAKVPRGFVVLNSKYRGNYLEKAILESGLKIAYDDSIGLIDCYPLSNYAVIVAQEFDLINEIELSQKVKKLSKFPHHKIILFEDTETSLQYYQKLQTNLLLSESQVKLIPFSSLRDVGVFLKQLNQIESNSIHFVVKNKGHPPCEDAIMAFLLSFPGIGEKKALQLLKHYPSIEEFNKANIEDLAKIVGQASANVIKQVLTT